MDQRPPRCAYLPCSEPVVTTLQNGGDTYLLCFDHLRAAALEGLVNEQRALRAETRYVELLHQPRGMRSDLARRLDALRRVSLGYSTREPGPHRAGAPGRVRRASPLPA